MVGWAPHPELLGLGPAGGPPSPGPHLQPPHQELPAQVTARSLKLLQYDMAPFPTHREGNQRKPSLMDSFIVGEDSRMSEARCARTRHERPPRVNTDRVAQHEGGQEPEDSFMGPRSCPPEGPGRVHRLPPPVLRGSWPPSSRPCPRHHPAPGSVCISSSAAPLGRTLVTASQARRIARALSPPPDPPRSHTGTVCSCTAVMLPGSGVRAWPSRGPCHSTSHRWTPAADVGTHARCRR